MRLITRKTYILFEDTVEFEPGNLLVQALPVAPTEGSNRDAEAVVEAAEETGEDETAVAASSEDTDASVLEIDDTVR